MTELPRGWTITVENRKAGALEAAESAFTDGRQLTVRDPDNVKPAQAEWPTHWHENAIRYVWAQHEHRVAQARGEVPHPHVEPKEWAENLLQHWPSPPARIAPEDWTGPLHQRPGLFALKDDETSTGGGPRPELRAPEAMSPDKAPRGVTTLLNKAGAGWTHRVRHMTADVVFRVLSDEEDNDGHRRYKSVTEVVDSIGVRFDHPDGRAAVALWMRREGKSFAFAGAQRGRHSGENVPVTLNATELGAYLGEDREDGD
jgi:hypothetical protein